MFKNIIIGVVVTAISAGLIFGAVYRTEQRADTGTRSQSLQSNNGANGLSGSNDGNRRSNNGSEGSLQGQGHQNDRSVQGSHSGSISSWNNQSILVNAFVQFVDENSLMALTAEGEQISIENRAWWFAVQAGFSSHAGDEVLISGFREENGHFEVIWIEDLSTGNMVQIRSEDGHPLWRGSGNGGANRKNGSTPGLKEFTN